MVDVSQNNWPVLEADSELLYTWLIPGAHGDFNLKLHRGPAGFLLCHYALWHDFSLEPVAGGVNDFGYNKRVIAGSRIFSNHASATAADINSNEHPSGTHTFDSAQVAAIHNWLPLYDDVIRWGGDFNTTVDQMHFEINATPQKTKRVAGELWETPRGLRLLNANPTQKKFVIPTA